MVVVLVLALARGIEQGPVKARGAGTRLVRVKQRDGLGAKTGAADLAEHVVEVECRLCARKRKVHVLRLRQRKGKVLAQVKGEKIIIYKYKSKKNYHRKAGHRQAYTKVEITAVG